MSFSPASCFDSQIISITPNITWSNLMELCKCKNLRGSVNNDAICDKASICGGCTGDNLCVDAGGARYCDILGDNVAVDCNRFQITRDLPACLCPGGGTLISSDVCEEISKG